jgi:hypothetical protein
LHPLEFEIGFPSGEDLTAMLRRNDRGRELDKMKHDLDCLVPSAEDRVLCALQELLDSSDWDRRTSRRISYFGPVTVGLPDVDYVTLSAFARDISPGGVGLVHLMPLEKGEVVIGLTLPSGKPLSLRTQICWCRDYSNGWYASGGRFLAVDE